MVVGAFPLDGKIAVVTGAGSGINLAFAKQAVAQGARVVIADIQLTDDAKAFLAANEKSVVFAKTDVTKRADLENTVTQAQTSFGDVPDVYIAGAGVFEPDWSSFWDDTEDDGYKQVEINVNHPMKLSRIAIKSLVKAKKPGVILVVASLAGYQGAFASPLYCATKHAVVGFVRSVADLDELQNIKVVLVAPGYVHTPMWTADPVKMKQFDYKPSMAVMPEEVAEGMVDLVTKAEYGGGACLQVAVGERRTLGVWNIPAPDTDGARVDKAVLEQNYKPVLEKMRNV
ncbi:hypothetical protein SEUCBS140593_009168 [Sporothrix eucalyptigena]|uniref:NAD(P)-binding protein n=1 Tax=Sporothrix eucalyptigena TaxID=1812306 RepID=A0ABP0CVP4_9PEZI